MLAANHLVRTRRVSASIGTEAGDVERAELRVLDVSHRAVRAERTKAAGVMRTCRSAQLARG